MLGDVLALMSAPVVFVLVGFALRRAGTAVLVVLDRRARFQVWGGGEGGNRECGSYSALSHEFGGKQWGREMEIGRGKARGTYNRRGATGGGGSDIVRGLRAVICMGKVIEDLTFLARTSALSPPFSRFS